MNREELRAFCLSKPGAWEDHPFGDDTVVFKVAERMFALMPVSGPLTISLKCDPVWAQILRDTYPAVTPAYHFNKRHWNGLALEDDSLPPDEVLAMIDHSYELVVKALPRASREKLPPPQK